MEIKTLKGVEIHHILEAFNSSFTNYFIPLQFTQEQLQTRLEKYNVDLDLSLGVFRDEQLLAFILHGVDIEDGKRAIYNAATGVIPSERSKGLTQKMYDFIVPILKDQNFEYSILEVISENNAALKSYANSGFIPTRELLCYYGDPTITKENQQVEIRQMEVYDWDLMKSFWDIIPSWQNSQNSMDRIQNSVLSLGAYLENQLVGYVIYQPKSKRIPQIAVSKSHRQKGIASRLIQEILKSNEPSLSIINVDKKGENINVFLEKIGLKNDIQQIEMKLDLNASI